MFSLFVAALLALSASAVALPSLDARDATEISPSQLAGYSPFTQFARAAYCPSSKIIPWNCGEACAANGNFQPSLIGGDGSATQFYFVGYWPDQNSVVVAHQGTNIEHLWVVSLFNGSPAVATSAWFSPIFANRYADLTDLDISKKSLNSTLFPGVPSNVLVHGGFANEHATTATAILGEVQRLLLSYSAPTVLSIGHSLGGALAELDAMFFSLNLPPSVHVKAVTYGTPRVGNPAWAAFFDSKAPDFVRINNKKDPVPTIPGRFLGFQHPHGEIHIAGPAEAYSCPGDDDATDSQCSVSQVPSIVESHVDDHSGPYEGIFIGTAYCT